MRAEERARHARELYQPGDSSDLPSKRRQTRAANEHERLGPGSNR
jgi:hypothetical protein